MGVEGRIIGSLKSLDGRRSGNATCIIFVNKNSHIDVSFELHISRCESSHALLSSSLPKTDMLTNVNTITHISMLNYVEYLSVFTQ